MARAPGDKAGADPPSVHRDPGRLVAFSDAVFAITITLLVLEIRPPVLGALLPALGVVVVAAFNAFYWLPIRGESPRPRPS